MFRAKKWFSKVTDTTSKLGSDLKMSGSYWVIQKSDIDQMKVMNFTIRKFVEVFHSIVRMKEMDEIFFL